MSGSEQMGGREKGAPAGNSSSGGGAAMAGGVELTGVFGSGATVHGLMNREHRERDGKQANSSRPRARPKVAVGAGSPWPAARAHGRTRNGL